MPRLVKSLLAALAALGILSVVAPSLAVAAAHPIHCKGVTVSSSALRIEAVLSGAAQEFRGTLRVKATRKGRKPYFLPSGNLVSSASARYRIEPSQIEITNPPAPLPFDKKKGKGRWRSIPVEVKGVEFAGEYEGGLELGSGGCKVEFVVVAQGAAEIGLVGTGTKAVELKLVRCTYNTCGPGLIQRLNSRSSRVDSVEVQVDNASQSRAKITAVQVALNSEIGEEAVAEEAFTPPQHTFFVDAQHATTLPEIKIDRGKIEPGHYTGAIYLTVSGAEKRTVLPFELDVKDGPFWAIAVLFAALLVQLGVWLSALVRPSRDSPSGDKELRRQANAKLGEDAELFERRFDQAGELALRGRSNRANKAYRKIEGDIQLVQEAQEIEASARVGGTLPDEVDGQLKYFRSLVKNGSEKAKSQLKQVKGMVDELTAESPAVAPAVDAVGDKKARIDRGATILRNAAQWVTGVIEAEFRKLGRVGIWLTVNVLPWALRTVLVLVFVLAGLKELYFSNATFGAQAAADYGGLFLWGLTAAGFNFVVGKVLPGAGKD